MHVGSFKYKNYTSIFRYYLNNIVNSADYISNLLKYIYYNIITVNMFNYHCSYSYWYHETEVFHTNANMYNCFSHATLD